jgi:hypothetical protein
MTQQIRDCTAEYNSFRLSCVKRKALFSGSNAENCNNVNVLPPQAFKRLVSIAFDSYDNPRILSCYNIFFIRTLNMYVRSLNDGISLIRRRDDENLFKFAVELHEEVCEMAFCIEYDILPSISSKLKQIRSLSPSFSLLSSMAIKLGHTSKVIFPCLLIHLELIVSAKLRYKVASIMNSSSGRENFRGRKKIQNTTVRDGIVQQCLLPFSLFMKTRCGKTSTRRIYTACVREITVSE